MTALIVTVAPNVHLQLFLNITMKVHILLVILLFVVPLLPDAWKNSYQNFH
jgi:hypothetical protein